MGSSSFGSPYDLFKVISGLYFVVERKLKENTMKMKYSRGFLFNNIFFYERNLNDESIFTCIAFTVHLYITYYMKYIIWHQRYVLTMKYILFGKPYLIIMALFDSFIQSHKCSYFWIKIHKFSSIKIIN